MPRIARAGGVVSTLIATVWSHLTLSCRPFERIVGLFEKQTIDRGFDLSYVTLELASLAAEFGELEGRTPCAGPVAGHRHPRLALLRCRCGTH